jgi:hypothetical protein
MIFVVIVSFILDINILILKSFVCIITFMISLPMLVVVGVDGGWNWGVLVDGLIF